MSLYVCPAAEVEAPLEVVWELLQPIHFQEWIDGEVDRVIPPGPAMAGQTIDLRSKAFGRYWQAALTIESVDAEKHQLGMRGVFPFGIQMTEHISCARLDASTCRVQYG